MRRSQSIFAFATLALISASSGHAQNSDAYCSRYAQEADSAADYVRNNACGFDESHPQWNTDSTAHDNWCLKAKYDDVERERANRASQLDRCGMCRRYAQEAIEQVTLARKYGCQRVDPARWSRQESDHFNWCMDLDEYSGPASPRYIEAAWRESLLNTCLHRNPDYCNDYAKEAVANAKSVRADQCGAHVNDPALWSQNYNDHLKACQSQKFLYTEGKRKQRAPEVASCSKCREYAKEAIAQLNMAIGYKCAVSGGGRWTANEDNHFFWCRENLAKHSDWLQTEKAARLKEIEVCTANYSGVPVLRISREPVGAKKFRSGSNPSSQTGVIERKKTGVTTLPESSSKRTVPPGPGETSLSNANAVRSRTNPCSGSNANRLPCKPPAAGLLEGDTGFSRQGPASMGTPVAPVPVPSVRIR